MERFLRQMAIIPVAVAVLVASSVAGYTGLSVNYKSFRSVIGSFDVAGYHLAIDQAIEFETLRWHANRGNSEAQYNLGFTYKSGRLGEKNFVQARRWFEAAAMAGHAKAALRLGFLYIYGEGVPVNEEAAVSWFIKAGQLGSERAAHIVGVYYVTGIGVPQDLKKGLMWLKKADKSEAQGLILALEERERVLEKMSGHEKESFDNLIRATLAIEGRRILNKQRMKRIPAKPSDQIHQVTFE